VIVLVTVLLARRITGPLSRLAFAAERIGQGDLHTRVDVDTRNEIGLLAARLDSMRSALQARDERLQMMLAGIAHEVRNPLGGLELYAGLLNEGLAGQPDRLAEVARLQREIGYLGRVVEEFLEYTRRSAPDLGPVDMGELLAEVAEVCGVAAGAPIRVQTEADVFARADRGQIRRAIINLTKNAVAAAGPSGNVTLAARREAGDKILVEVRDSGAGVPPELDEKIFAPFFTTREKGTGLGLAFVRDIVIDHHGEVGVDQAPEGGARFWVALKAR
jgi:signal transduction histidine kinase